MVDTLVSDIERKSVEQRGSELLEPDRSAQDRWEWFTQSRRDSKGRLLRKTYLAASKKRRILEKGLGALPGATPGPAGSVNWTPIGPSVVSTGGTTVSGRMTSLAAGPAGTRIYAGSANGGVWFSPDGGANWSPLDDYIVSPSLFGGAAEADSLSVGALAVRFGASALADEVYVGTGEPTGNYDAYMGIGIRHLAAGSWTLEATNLAGRGIYEIAIDPDTPTIVFAATTGGLFRRPTSGSMANWTQVTSTAFANSNGALSSFVIAGNGTSKVYYAAFYSDKVYRSTDGVAWTALTGLSGTGRIGLAAGESDPTVVYALRADGTLNRLSGTSFSVVSGLPASVLFADPGGGQGWYDLAIAVDPGNANTVILGGDAYALFKGTITGGPGSFVFPFNAANTGTPTNDPTWVGGGVHSDVHRLAYALNAGGTAHDPGIVLCGSDGGVFLSTGSGNAGTFQSKNLGLAVTQFAYLAQRADVDSVVLAGAQDNGTPRLLGEQAARDTAGGDGGGVAYDPTNAYRVLRQYVRSSLYVTANGGASWSNVNFPPITANTTAQQNAAQTENSTTNFVAPLASGSSGSTALAAFGTNRLWLTKDWGASWVTLPTATNPYISATPDLTQDVIGSGNVTAIAFASATRIFAATSNAIWRYDTTTNWASATRTIVPVAGLPTRPITAVAVENAATGTIYVTLGSGGIAHVYYFDGIVWTAALPTSVVDVPTHTVVVDPANPNNVYVGTDVGVFKGVKSGSTWAWSLFSQGLPESAVTHLQIHAPSRLLRAATHGRGVWEIALDAASGADPDIYLRVNYNDTGRIIAGQRTPWVENHDDPTHFDAVNPYVLYHWMSADIKVRRSSLAGLPSLSSPVSYLDFAVNIGDYVDSVQHIETADVSGVDRIFVEVHNRSLTSIPAAQVKVLLLVADASAGLPALPAGYAAQINAGNVGWLSGSSWRFVDPVTPYRTLARDLDVRTPQVVEYQLDFSALGIPAGHEHVCLAAFVSTPGDPITATNISLDAAAMSDKHIAHRNTHLVALGTRPGTELGSPLPPETFVIDFHNPGAKPQVVDLAFDRTHFPGEVALLLTEGLPDQTAHGLKLVAGDRSQDDIAKAARASLSQLLSLLERELLEEAKSNPGQEEFKRKWLRKLSRLDRERCYVATEGKTEITIPKVHLEPGSFVTAAVTVRAPARAKRGDVFRLDVLQRRGGRVSGGSTYILPTLKERRVSDR